MDANYLRAAGRNGFPSAFIVDQQGKIAWMGRPASMDFVLHEVVEGKWDLTTDPERNTAVYERHGADARGPRQDPRGLQGEFGAVAALAVRDPPRASYRAGGSSNSGASWSGPAGSGSARLRHSLSAPPKR